MAVHQTNMGRMQSQPQSDSERANLLESKVKSELEEPSRGLLHNLSARDLPLANFSGEDVHEQKWLQEILLEYHQAMHPHSESVLQGTLREWAFDDPAESYEALDGAERIESETYSWGAYSRATRAEGGFEQENNSKQMTESIARSPDREKSSGGILGRLRG
jgi:hypothetical protein